MGELIASRHEIDYGQVEAETLARVETVELRSSGSAPFRILSLDLPENIRALEPACDEAREAKTPCAIRLQFQARTLGAFRSIATIHTDLGSVEVELKANVFWRLEIEAQGDGSGTVECLDGSCFCTTGCTVRTTAPAVRMRARDDGDGFFTSWGGACTGADGCMAEFRGSHSVAAIFRKHWTHTYDGPAGRDDSAAAVRTIGTDILIIGTASIGGRHGVSFLKYAGDGRVYWEMPDIKPANEAASDSFGIAMGLTGSRLSSDLLAVGAHASSATFFYSMKLGEALSGRSIYVDVNGVEPKLRGLSRDGSVFFGSLGARGWAQRRRTFDWIDPADEGTSSIRAAANMKNALYLGGTRSTPTGTEAPTLRKLDDEGLQLWQFAFDNQRAGAIVGMDATHDRVVVCGYDATKVGQYLWVASVSANGTLQWEYRDGVTAGQSGARALTLAPNGDVLIAGYAQLENANAVPRLTRLTANGALIWKRDLAPMPLADARDHMQSVDVDAEGSVVVVGRSPARGGDAWIRKYFQPQQFVAPPVAASDERRGLGTHQSDRVHDQSTN